MNLFLFLLSALFSCTPPPDDPSPLPPGLDLTENEEKMIGQWQETGRYILSVDSLNQVVDTIDANVTITFNYDFTYTAANDIYFDAASGTGTWAVDTTVSNIQIVMNPDKVYSPNSVGTRNHSWNVDFPDPTHMEVWHTYEYYDVGGATLFGVTLPRHFVKQ